MKLSISFQFTKKGKDLTPYNFQLRFFFFLNSTYNMLLLEGMQLLLISLNTAYFFSNFMDSDGLPQGFLYWINSNLHSNCNRFNFSSPSAVLLHEQKHQYFTSHSILQKQENKPIKAGLLHKYATYLNQCIPARIFIVFSNSKKSLQT